jgi:cyclopropane fatty-acyl-phospholipid synthase-like methyltransferase
MIDKPFAPATERNSQAILDVIRHEFRKCRSVLEIGSGTGQHAVTFASELSHLTWQTSDRDENHDGINAWLSDAVSENVLPPLSLDVLTETCAESNYDGVFSANTSHIMSFAAVKKMFAIASSTLLDDGVFCLYGPFSIDGNFNSASNDEFDRSLRARDAQMGIRDLADLDQLAGAHCLRRTGLYSMPANNYLAVWLKQTDEKKP